MTKSRTKSRKIEAFGWVLLVISLGVLVTKLVQRSVHPPVAESRRMPATAVSEGAWWFTGKPAPTASSTEAPPDLTGVWQGDAIGNIAEAAVPGQEMVLTAEGKRRWETVDHAKNPTSACLPPGPVRNMLMMLPVMIVQRPDVVVFLSEYQRTYRIIYTDGRGHDPEIKDYPEWMGDSIGHWEDDVLVVDTVGIRDRSWLDYAGHEHSDQLHMIERFALLDANRIEVFTTFEDPVFFAKPFTMRRILERQIGDRILDYSCLENERDQQNLQPTIGDAGR